MSKKVIGSECLPVILVGGLGSRIKHLLKDKPKPMAMVAGRPFIEWVIRFLKGQGFGRVLLSTGYLGEQIEDYFGRHPVAGMEVECFKEDAPHGTGGGFLYAARGSERTPFSWLVMNGDSLTLCNLSRMLKGVEEKETDGIVVGVIQSDASRYGTLKVDDEGLLQSFDEKRKGSGLVNSGIYLFKHNVLASFPSQEVLSFEEEVFPSLIKQKYRVKIEEIEAPFLDIGTPQSLCLADAFIKGNKSYFDLS